MVGGFRVLLRPKLGLGGGGFRVLLRPKLGAVCVGGGLEFY